jgi:hypothetical protein
MSGVAKVLMSPLTALVGSVMKKPKPQQVVAQPVATPRTNSVLSDALSARRGTASNQRTGAGGAESGAGKKTLLGS